MVNILKRIALLLGGVIVLGAFSSCGDVDSKADEGENSKKSNNTTQTFEITLYPDYAPITCENFEKLVSDGFYDGLTFHRVVDNFMAQGGDPNGDGTGGSSQTIKGEFSSNGVENTLSHTRGIVSMARSTPMDSATSQFFICYSDEDVFLDGDYAAFGEVTTGMDVVDSFTQIEKAQASNGEFSIPTQPITIVKAEMIDDNSDGNPVAKFHVTVGE